MDTAVAPGPGERELVQEIGELRRRHGELLLLLAHHYQRPEVAVLADRLGDSYELARFAQQARAARFIVFCGVRFMAEAADVLRSEDQAVFHPAPEAGCPLADFAPLAAVEAAWEAIGRLHPPGEVMPLVYMNSSAGLKALVGRHGGAVCTSGNAARAFGWALAQRRALFFLPDEHLGRNTARAAGIPEVEIALWDPDSPDGGLEAERLRSARVILWKGHCHVHTAFTVEDVAWARARFPGARLLVHPECPTPVVEAADGAGSTAFLVKEVERAAPGATLVIGTEINLVARLAASYPDRAVVPLRRSLCGNMSRISLARLRDTLRALPGGEPVCVPHDVRCDARVALERMLAIKASDALSNGEKL